MHLMLVRVGLWELMGKELEKQNRFFEQDLYRPLIIRQSAFFEDYLTLHCQLEFQALKEGTLANSELTLIDNMGHSARINLANLLGVIDQDDHDDLAEMAKVRNEIAHQAWTDTNNEQEARLRRVAERARDLLEKLMEDTRYGLLRGCYHTQ